MQNIVTLGEINDALKIAAVSAAQLADMGFPALANKPICEGLPPEESRRLRNAKLYPAESIGQIRVALAQRFAEPTSAADVPASGAAALSEYLKTCEQHQIVPDVGGAFASAFAAGFNLASSQTAQREATAAIKTLQNLGYTYHDAELWKPPIGKVPDFDLVDSLRNRISELEASQAAPAAVAVPDDRAAFERELIDNHQYVPSDFSFKDGFYNGDDDYIQFGWDVWQARAALAATPAAAPQTQPVEVDSHTMELAESVGLIGPTSRTQDLHAAIQRFHDLIVVNASIKAAQDFAKELKKLTAAAPVVLPEPVGEVVLFGGTHKELSWRKGRLPKVGAKLFTEQQLRALLATATGLPAQSVEVDDRMALAFHHAITDGAIGQDDLNEIKIGLRAVLVNLHAPQAQADARDAIRELIAKHRAELEHNDYAYFELAYTRRTGWMAWITDKPLNGGPVINPDRKVLARGQGDTAEEACSAAIAAAKGE